MSLCEQGARGNQKSEVAQHDFAELKGRARDPHLVDCFHSGRERPRQRPRLGLVRRLWPPRAATLAAAVPASAASAALVEAVWAECVKHYKEIVAALKAKKAAGP